MVFFSKLSENVVLKLIEVMINNSYACFFHSLRHVPNLESHQIVLKTHCDSDQRIFNKSTVSQVAALWVEGEGLEQTYSRHIQVYTKGLESHRVQYYYGCYDPLQYPLLFPLGETGWQPRIKRPRNGNPKK